MSKDKMTESFLDLEKEEKRCEGMVSRELKEAFQINLETLDILNSLFGNASGRLEANEMELYQKVHGLLYPRMANDLRTIQILIKKGYISEAATIASALFEGSLQMRYIDSNNGKAKEWFEHKDEKRSVWPVRTLIENLGLGEGTEYVWTLLCKIKHYKPDLIAGFHLTQKSSSGFLIRVGPHLRDEDRIHMEVILTYSSLLVIEAIDEIYEHFVKYHSQPEEWKDKFGVLRQKASDYSEHLSEKLRASSVQENSRGALEERPQGNRKK